MTGSTEHSGARILADDVSRFDEVAESACERLGRNKRVRRNLPGGGRLRMDRQLPFLCVHRFPPERDDPGTRELVTTEAAYLFASGKRSYHEGLTGLCQQIATAMQEHFGTFLFLEIWAQEPSDASAEVSRPAIPSFEIMGADPDSLPSTMDAFTEALSHIKIQGHSADVRTRTCEGFSPPGLLPLTPICPDDQPGGCCRLGIAVRPIYRDPQTEMLFPIVLQHLRRQLSRALRKGIAEFTGIKSGGKRVHYESLGPSSMVKAARLVDQELCDVAESFDFLLQVTPTNSEQAWDEFKREGYKSTPTFTYRPLPYHPNLLKRRLFETPIERIEDPTLAHLFWEKQDEVDRQLTALRDLNTPRFLQSSLQLHGSADDELLKLSRSILDATPPPEAIPDSVPGEFATAGDVAEQARNEIDHYYQRLNAFNPTVEICDHIAAGIMVSHDRLLIAEDLRLRADRVQPLLHHEIGTHLLTYFNGRCQPLRQLYSGLAGYDELQEGLAVMAEYLCGGLTTNRLRALAGRVIAVRSLTDGATFPETFQELHETFHFSRRKSFITTLRVHRGGGYTKDLIYLRGLRDVLSYLGAGHDIEPLYVGKIGLQHLPYVQELRRRGIIDAPSLLPRFWDDEHLRERLEACRGRTPVQLLEDNR